MAEAKKEMSVMDQVGNTLDSMESQFSKALPDNVPAKKFIRVVRTALQKNPDLLAADRHSLYAACMDCATDGLIPDGREAALVPFKKKGSEVKSIKYLPMVKGICKRARNSGEIGTIDAFDVYEADSYRYWVDEKGPHMLYEPARGGKAGEPILTVGYAITKDGFLYLEEVTPEQMKAIESVSKAQGEIWEGPFRSEMRRKSALRRLGKYRLPSSADLDSTFQADDEAVGMDMTPAPKMLPADKPARLGAIIEATATKEEPALPAEKAPVNQVPI